MNQRQNSKIALTSTAKNTNSKHNDLSNHYFAVLRGGHDQNNFELLSPWLANKEVAQIYQAHLKNEFPQSHIGHWTSDSENRQLPFDSIDSDFRQIDYWADDHLIVFDNKYWLIDNSSQKIIFQTKADSDNEAVAKCLAYSKQIKNFKFHKDFCQVASLPFITIDKIESGRNWFDMPVTGDYGIDCNTGKHCAHMLIKAIGEDKPTGCGVLQTIVLTLMDRPGSEKELRGIVVGFFSELDSWIKWAADNGGERLNDTSYEQLIDKVQTGLKAGGDYGLY